MYFILKLSSDNSYCNLPEQEFPHNPFQLYQHICVPFSKQAEILDGPAYFEGSVILLMEYCSDTNMLVRTFSQKLIIKIKLKKT